jgi:serine/threonine-protein kinase RsbW
MAAFFITNFPLTFAGVKPFHMVDNNPRLIASANFCLDWQTVSHALDLLEAFLEGQSLDDNVRTRLAIIVEELVANIVEHGAPPADAPVSLELERSGDEITMLLSDSGVAFDPCCWVQPDQLPPERGGGAGLALVQGWAASMSYSRFDGRNILKLVIPAYG